MPSDHENACRACRIASTPPPLAHHPPSTIHRLQAPRYRGPCMEIATAFAALGIIRTARTLGPRTRGMVSVDCDSSRRQQSRRSAPLCGRVGRTARTLGRAAPTTCICPVAAPRSGARQALPFKGHYAGLPAANSGLHGTRASRLGQGCRAFRRGRRLTECPLGYRARNLDHRYLPVLGVAMPAPMPPQPNAVLNTASPQARRGPGHLRALILRPPQICPPQICPPQTSPPQTCPPPGAWSMICAGANPPLSRQTRAMLAACAQAWPRAAISHVSGLATPTGSKASPQGPLPRPASSAPAQACSGQPKISSLPQSRC